MPSPPFPTANSNELSRLIGDLRNLIRLHQQLGIEDYPATPGLLRLLTPTPVPKSAPAKSGAAGSRRVTDQGGRRVSGHGVPQVAASGTGLRPAAPQSGRPPQEAVPGDRLPGKTPAAAAVGDLNDLDRQSQNCQRCSLRKPGTKVVFGQGNPQAALLLIGPAPGPAEAAAGLPFQGEAGALLDRMLAAIGLNRQTVYLTTLLKCLPPEATEPEPEQIRACLTILQQQIAAVNPRLICTLDTLPAHALLKSRRNLFQLRGRFHDYQGIPLMPTLPPALLLQNPEMKKAAWEDLQLIQKALSR